MAKTVRVTFIVGIAVLVIGSPLLYWRYHLTTTKRLREIVPGRFYRSGQMTVSGFEETLERWGIRMVINVQNEFPDPDLRRSFLNSDTEKESEVCRRLGVKYVILEPDLVSRRAVPDTQPQVIAQFLQLMDNPENYPVLIHCKAGLHRTGCLVAVYRMEYEGWSAHDTIDEMKDLGFGDMACTSANDYITQYVLTYKRRAVRGAAGSAP
ncbi:MAG TPA: dual specificity protein phosphatase family protein [Gemmataceae bacterium]|jgi:protein tyrosine/serine phosphatase|nr:dual specificity protein phosphatase family protein [Gemmataceae bacterium]